MRLGGRMQVVGRGVVATLAAVTLLAVPAGAILERGPSGEARPGVVPLALAAFDPYVWTVLSHSLGLASAATVGAWVLGVGLARAGRSGGRLARMLAASVALPLAMPPLAGALGMRGLLGRIGLAPDAMEGSVGWGAWLWVELAWSVPLVARAAGRALRDVDPSWEEAARQLGGGRHAWRVIVRPVVRPRVARTLAVVFGLTLVEPGVPLALGLRRTLAFQLVEAALRPDDRTRAAALAVLALALVLAVNLALRRWAGRLAPEPAESPRAAPRTRPAPARRRVAGAVVLVVWATLALAPTVGLALLALDPTPTPTAGRGPFGHLGAAEVRGLLGSSLILGASAATLALVVARLVARPRGSDDPPGRFGRIVRAGAIPPLVLALGAAMLPGLLRQAAGALGVAAPLRTLARALDPASSPPVLLAWAIVLSHLPTLAAALESVASRARPVLVDAARVLGVPRRRAAWAATWPLVGAALAACWLRAAVLAALDVASAVVLTPTAASRTLGPGLLDLASRPGGLREAAALALSGTAIGLLAMALAARAGLAELAAEPTR